ncbi:MAG: bifunctional methylenetetrahydrofolate dehydrogenase/methenyltetrahydrofolate cyclohydrolase FolD [Planctomycetota bacterium]
MAQVIDGKRVALECRAALRERIAEYTPKRGHAPGLGVILVGDDPASQVYVRNKEKACAKAGIASFHNKLEENAPQAEVEAIIDKLNADPRVHGILLQLPLPQHLSEQTLVDRILPEKDVDGIHPVNAGYLALGRPRFVPCTPRGIMRLIEETGREIRGARAVVVGRSNLVGKPAAQLLLGCHATVTLCHSRTAELAAEVSRSEIVVAALGRLEFIKGDWIRDGAVVIDVGINRREDGSLGGDVEFKAACERAAWITPVPGGVGPMTVAMLLENTFEAATRYDPVSR